MYKLLLTVCFFSLAFAACKTGDKQSKNLKQITVPLAGNTYLTKGPKSERITGKGITKWKTPSNVYSVFVKSSKPVKVKLAIQARVSSGKNKIRIKAGNVSKEVALQDTTFKQVLVGKAKLKKGYNRINITGNSKSGPKDVQISDLILQIPKDDSLIYVKDNKHNHFYWGRRGPSVHLVYKLPVQKDIEWFYSEVTVPKGMDPVGSYFMADGFGQGYFGMQVNSKSTRHILFSVWSPYKTNNPGDIPDSMRIKLLKKGKGVHAGKFGGEGSGGQSYWTYDWKPGVTYKFLVKVKPKTNNETAYTAYFYASKIGKWKLIASFSRPKTDTWLTGAYSFVENFADYNGYKNRKAYFGRQWARDKSGNWHEITQATFTGDNIANIGYRTDFKGGVKKGRFYLMNGGFFNDNTPLGAHLERHSAGKHPQINFNKLP
jgi:hypothetical protein